MREATVAELQERAKALGIEAPYKLKKAELLEAIEKAEAQPIEQSKDEPEIEKSSSESLDYQNHPKFHKFKAQPKGAV